MIVEALEEVDRRAGGVVDAVEADRGIWIAEDAAGDAEGRFAGGGRRIEPGAVGQDRARALAHAPVVAQARGAGDRFAVAGRSTRGFAFDRQCVRGRRGRAAAVRDAQADLDAAVARVGVARGRRGAGIGLVGAVAVEVPFVLGDWALGVARSGGIEADGFAGFRRAGGVEGRDRAFVGDDAVEMVGDRRPVEGTTVDRDLVEIAGSEEAGAGPRHEVERRVGESGGAAAAFGLAVGDRFAVDVGHDLFRRRRRRVEHEGVVVPLAGRGPGEEGGVARGAAADADREAAVAAVRVDQEATGGFVEVVGELHCQRVVVGIAVPLEPELDRDRGLACEVHSGAGGVVDAVEAGGLVGVFADRSRDAERRFTGDRGRAGPDAVGEDRAGALAQAPVIVEAGGAEHGVRVSRRRAGFFFGFFFFFFAAAFGHDAFEVVFNGGRREGAAEDGDLVEFTGSEEAGAGARHQVERRVGEAARPGAAVELGVGDRFAVYVRGDLLGRRCVGVEHEGVVVPLAGRGPGEEDVVA